MKRIHAGSRVVLVLLFGGVLMIAAGCSSAASDPAELEGTWALESYADPEGSLVDVEADVESQLTLEEGTASGQGGVNTFNGSYEAEDDGSIAFGPLAATMMAGPEEAMDQEFAFLQALSDAEKYSVSGETLTLSDGDDGEVAVLVAE